MTNNHPTPQPHPDREEIAKLKIELAEFEDVLNLPPPGWNDEPLAVRDFRHSAYHRWTPVVRSILAILAKIGSPAVLDGWKLVPIEPTGAMTEAIEYAIYRNADCSARDAERGAPHVYRAMISSAPEPQVQEGENQIGAAERDVGQFFYQRVEKLMDAKAGTSEGRELTYLSDIISGVEEYGLEAMAEWDGEHFRAPEPPK